MNNDILILSNDDLISKMASIYEDSFLKISYIDNDAQDTLISFSHGEPFSDAREDIPVYRKINKNILYIVDKKTTWFNSFSVDLVLEKISSLILNKNVTLIGASVGGFNAIYLSNFIKSDLCLAICPQYSIAGELVGWQEITKNLVQRITAKNLNTVKFSKTTKYRFIFGNDDQEVDAYSRIIPKCINDGIDFEYIIFKDAGHNIPPFLKQNGISEGYMLTESFIKKDIRDVHEFYKHLETIKFE